MYHNRNRKPQAKNEQDQQRNGREASNIVLLIHELNTFYVSECAFNEFMHSAVCIIALYRTIINRTVFKDPVRCDVSKCTHYSHQINSIIGPDYLIFDI